MRASTIDARRRPEGVRILVRGRHGLRSSSSDARRGRPHPRCRGARKLDARGATTRRDRAAAGDAPSSPRSSSSTWSSERAPTTTDPVASRAPTIGCPDAEPESVGRPTSSAKFPTAPDAPDRSGDAPTGEVPPLPHWTEPPTGAVPAIFADDTGEHEVDDDLDAWATHHRQHSRASAAEGSDWAEGRLRRRSLSGEHEQLGALSEEGPVDEDAEFAEALARVAVPPAAGPPRPRRRPRPRP